MAEAKSSLILVLVGVADAYCAATGQSRAAVAKATLGRGGQIDALESGKRDLATGTFEKAMRWFSANWPADAQWPAGVARPETVAGVEDGCAAAEAAE